MTAGNDGGYQNPMCIIKRKDLLEEFPKVTIVRALPSKLPIEKLQVVYTIIMGQADLLPKNPASACTLLRHTVQKRAQPSLSHLPKFNHVDFQRSAISLLMARSHMLSSSSKLVFSIWF